MKKLMLIGNHLSNYSDISLRAVEALETADTIIYEFSNKFDYLVEYLGLSITNNTMTFLESDDPERRKQIVEDLINDKNVVMIADNGYPMIADPGIELAEYLFSNGIEIDVIPGPSISSTAYVMAALPGSGGDFVFQEYFGKKTEDIPDAINAIKDLPHNLVFVDLPLRFIDTVKILTDILGNREATFCVEITTPSSTVIRGRLSDVEDYIIDHYNENHAATLVVAGKR